MKPFLFIAVISIPAWGHVISMSTGHATVVGNRVEYVLIMPDYEIKGQQNPTDLLFGHIHFSSGYESGRIVDKECHHDKAKATWLCAANYEFAHPVERLGVECSFHEITVANHLHVLRAVRDGKDDRAILDSAFSSATLTFRPPTALEREVEQSAAGGIQVLTGVGVLFLLFALAITSRTPHEMIAGGAAFVVAQIAVACQSWQVPPRFAEAAAALALAYLGLETLLFPLAAGRWVIALLFGGFSGLYFSVFLQDSQYEAAFVLAGAAVASLCLLALFGAAARFLVRFRRLAAGLLMASGCAWLGVRLIG